MPVRSLIREIAFRFADFEDGLRQREVMPSRIGAYGTHLSHRHKSDLSGIDHLRGLAVSALDNQALTKPHDVFRVPAFEILIEVDVGHDSGRGIV